MNAGADSPAKRGGTDAALARQQRQLRRAIVGAEADAQVQRDADNLLAPRAAGSLLRIYRRAYRSRLNEALRDNYERLPRIMGDDAFDALAAAYGDAHPSRHPSIRWFGHALPDFMQSRPDLAPHPALADLARMEWALRDAFDAADAVPLGAEALATLPADAWPALRLTPVPSARLVPLRRAVEPLWRAALPRAQGGQEPDLPEPDLPEPQPHDHRLLVWRPQLQTQWRSLEPMEAALLAAVFSGEPFAHLCEIAAAHVGEADAAACVVGALQGWLAEGLLARTPAPAPHPASPQRGEE